MTIGTRLAAVALVLAAGLAAGCRPGRGGSTMQHGEQANQTPAASTAPDTRAPTERDLALSVELPPCAPSQPHAGESPTSVGGGHAVEGHAGSGAAPADHAVHAKGAQVHEMGMQMKEMADSMKASGMSMDGMNADEMMVMAEKMMDMGAMMMGMDEMAGEMKDMGAKMKNAGEKAKKKGKPKKKAKKPMGNMDPDKMSTMGDDMMQMGDEMMEMGGMGMPDKKDPMPAGDM